MKLRMFLNSMFKLNNLAILLVFTSISFILEAIYKTHFLLYAPAIAIYLIMVGQTLMSKKFHESFNQKEKIRKIQNLNYECLKLANETKRKVSSSYLQRLRKVMEEKSEILDSFFKGEHSFIKEKIVEQTLNLVIVYIRLMANFCIRSRELGDIDLSRVSERIVTNSRRLNFIKDVHIAEDVKNLIDMDEKMLERIKDEKKELERISAKLEYIESTINMFKHQILTSIESDEMLEKLQNAVNEAKALDTVLEDRRKSKMRI